MEHPALNITTEPIEPRQVQLTVEVDEARFEKAKRKAASEMSRQYKVPGYRPGKVPYARMVALIGEEPLLKEALELLGREAIAEAMVQEGLMPSAQVSLQIKSEDPPIFGALIPLPPEIKLGDYRSIRVPAPELEDPSDEDVDEIFDRLRRDMASMESVERAAEADDLVKIRMEARREDGGVSDGRVSDDRDEDDRDEDASAEKDEENEEVSTADAAEANSGAADEAADPGLVRSHDEMYVPLNEEGARQTGLPASVTDELIGLSAGEKTSFTVAYPDDWHDEALQGVSVVFDVEVQEVSEIILPELDDAFASSVSDMPSLEELRARVRTDLQMRQGSEMRDQHVESVVDALVAVASVAFPPAMLESEVQDLVRDLRERVERQGFTWERWLTMQDKEDEQLWAEFEEQAAARLTRGLVLGEFIEAEGIDLEAAEIQAEMDRIDSMLGKVPRKKRPNKQALLRQTGNRILTGRAIARLMAIATGEADETEAFNTDAEAASVSQPDSDIASDADASSEAEAAVGSED